MTGTSSLLYSELDPAKKNAEWYNSSVTLMRRDWRRLINANRSLADRQLLYSLQELSVVKNSFDDEEFKKCTEFFPLPILEPMINAVVEEITRNPPRAELRALDPTSTIEKKIDLNMLANRSVLEGDRSELQSRVGLPAYKMQPQDFNGNVEEFDKLGLDSNDPEDINFYGTNLQKLNWEIAGQSVIDAVFKNSRFDKETMRKLVKDAFSLKCVSAQKYVDEITGEIKDRYIDPATAYGIFGTTNDGTDDICRGWQAPRTVMEWLQLVGNEFDFYRDWQFLLWGINYCNNTRFTGFIRGGANFDCCGQPWSERMGLGDVLEPALLDWGMAYTYKVYVGYIETRTVEATSTFIVKYKDRAKEITEDVKSVPYSEILSEKQMKEGYEKESRYQMPWYKAYFIATTSVSQWIWGYGKVYMQNTSGANDEYCNGTLCYYQEEGLSAVEIARPYLSMANFTFYRMLWIIFKAKPDPDEYVFEELIQMAGKMQREFGQQGTGTSPVAGIDNMLMKIIQQQRAKHIKIRTYPRIDGKAVQQIHPIEQKGRGGLDPIAISMQAVCEWAEANVASKIGINRLRLGGNPQPRESTESEQATVQYSMATTGYIYRMLQYLKEHLSVSALSYAQDIIKFKDSIPYKWLMTIVGQESFSDLKSLDKFAFHRVGLFIDDYNTDLDKKDLKDAATIAMQQKEIGIDQWAAITQTSDPRRAIKILSRYKEKAAKQAQDYEMQKLQEVQGLEEQKHKWKMEEMAFDRGTRWGQADRESNAFIASAQINKEAKINTQELKDANQVAHDANKSAHNINEKKQEAALEEQSSVAKS